MSLEFHNRVHPNLRQVHEGRKRTLGSKKKSPKVESVHQKVKPFNCNFCECSFSRNTNLKDHVNRMHLKIKALKQFSCIKCEAFFERKQHLEQHMNSVHFKIKPYKCDYCDSCFASNSQLKSHVKTKHLNV